jgi:hypothetical protein
MIAAVDPASRHYGLFAASSMNPYDYDKQGRVLETALQETGRPDGGLLAVSELRSTALLIVLQTWHMVAQEKGLFSKRIEITERAGYLDITRLATRQVGVRGRDGMIIDGFGADGQPAFELRWGCGGPVSEEDAATERDRVYAIMAAQLETLGRASSRR